MAILYNSIKAGIDAEERAGKGTEPRAAKKGDKEVKVMVSRSHNTPTRSLNSVRKIVHHHVVKIRTIVCCRKE